MTDHIDQISDKSAVQSLRDFVDIGEDENLDLEVAIMDDGRVVVFHTHPFKNDLSWMEFDLDTRKLDFILDDGEIRDIGLPLSSTVSKYMQNSHQILTVLMDPETGDATEGSFIPLIIHRS